MRQEADRVRSFRRRGVVLGGAQVILFGALGGRLYQLQVQKGPAYELRAEDNRSNQRLLVPPRGRIFDRNRHPLAVNVPTYRVRLVREQAGDLRARLEQLAGILTLDAKTLSR